MNVVYIFFLIALSYTPVAAMCFLRISHLGEFDRLSCVRTYARIRTVVVLSSAVSDLSVDGHERKCSNILFSYRR